MEEYITRKNAIEAVDRRIEKLSQDKEFNYSKKVCVAGTKLIILDIPSENVIPTKDRYNPLKKILADYDIREGEKHNFSYCSELERELIEEILNENRND